MGRRKEIDKGSPEFLRSRRTGKIRLHQHDLIDQPPEWLGKASMILITHHAQDQDDAASGMGSERISEVVSQDPGSRRIMRAIHKNGRMVIDYF